MRSARWLTTAEGRNRGAFAPLDWGLLVSASVIFGSSFLLMAEGLDSFEPGVVTFLRIFFGFVALSVVPASRRPLDRADWPRLVVLGVTWFAAPLTFFPLAQQHIASSVAGMLNGSTPLFVAIVATLLLRRLPGPRQRVGIVLGLVGMVMIGLPTLDEGATSALGVALAVGAVASYGIAFNIAIPLQHRYGSLPMLWRAQIVALVLTSPLALYHLGGSAWSTEAFAACAVLGVFGTGIAYLAGATLTGRVGSTRSSVLTYLATPVSMALGVVVRDESIGVVVLVGAGVTLTGAWLTTRADRARAISDQELSATT